MSKLEKDHQFFYFNVYMKKKFYKGGCNYVCEKIEESKKTWVRKYVIYMYLYK